MFSGASYKIGDLKIKVELAIPASKARGDQAVHGGGRANPAIIE